MRLLADGAWLLHGVADRRDTNLALARAVMEACARQDDDTSAVADSAATNF